MNRCQCGSLCTCFESKSNNNNSSRASSSRTTKRTLAEFQQMPQSLGQGSFGWVTLVKELKTNQLYAMKTIKKAELFKYSTVDNLKREIKIQRKLNHPNVIRLDSYFEDKENVYLILEYAEGGSLFKQIKKKHRLDESEAFVYFYQTCIGIDYLHKQKIIHRDLKPENLLLDQKGNIKICDFGWSTEVFNKKNIFCGTVEYMAPEMIKQKGHSYKLDIWCLGVLLYEMVQGRPPFIGKTQNDKFEQILSSRPLKYDYTVSADCISLISLIMQQNAIQRPSIQEIFQHRWMQDKAKLYHVNLFDDNTPRSMSQSYLHDTMKSSLSERETLALTRSPTNNERQKKEQSNFFRSLFISLGCIQR